MRFLNNPVAAIKGTRVKLDKEIFLQRKSNFYEIQSIRSAKSKKYYDTTSFP